MSSPLVISELSLEYVRVPVSAKQSGLTVDPTADTVKLAFSAAGVDPSSGDYKTSSWETDATTTPATYYARCLVGPAGTVALAAGTYEVWVKITDSPEIPVLRSGTLVVK